MWILGLKGLINQAPVVQMVDSATHWINHYPTDQHQESKLLSLSYIVVTICLLIG